MERAMRAAGLGESDFHRIVLVAGITIAVMTGLLLGKPFYYAMTSPKAVPSAQPVAGQELKAEPVSFVTSPTIDTNPQFFFGSGDGSAGYYGERPEPTPSSTNR
jgi:hypothetical protein